MAWAPKTLADIPFILVGPILRKVTPNSVNVFIATKESCEARLVIYKHNGTNVATTIATGVNAPMLQIGANMFIGVLTVAVPNEMSPGITYGYTIEFTINGTVYSLSTINNYDHLPLPRISLSNIVFNFGSQTGSIPTFVLPPYDATKLRVLHGSCRKSHGEGLDAMENVWTILYATATNPDTVTDPAERRPQMMFLTGDQIYADDVSDIMLYMIDKYAQLLLGWDENLAPLGCDINNLAPGKRADNITNVAKFSVDKKVAGSHLMKLREFILMYCMTWSNALWQDDPSKPGFPILPTFEDLYPVESTEITVNGDGSYMFGNYNPSVTFSTDITYDSETFKHYDDYCKYINKLYQSVNGNFRAILANIPLYMILDDHEITDDLFYNGQWFQDAVEGSLLGKRICTNGMAAYALFQDWGNKPEDYITGSIGKVLLNLIAGLRTNPDDSVAWNTVSSIVLPILDTSSTPAKFKHLDPVDGIATSLNWNYYYEVSNAYEFIVLDTRTMRVFDKGLDGRPGLLSAEALTSQIEVQGSDKSKPLIFVISPTPVIEVNKAQRHKEFALFIGAAGKLTLDLENWSYDSKSNEHFYSKLFTRNTNRTFLQVVLLGGDVHYAYSSRMQYWVNQPYGETFHGPKQMAIAGLCASSFKNELSASSVSLGEKIPTLEAYSKGLHPYILNSLKDKTAMYGWQNSSQSSFTISINIPAASSIPTLLYTKGNSPYRFDRNSIFTETKIAEITNNPAHDWHYRILPMKRINPGFVPTPGNGSSLESYKSYIQAHKELYEKSGAGGTYIVGYNNMGDIVLESGSQGIGFVYHRIWWANDADRVYYDNTPGFPDVGSPYTIHKIDMGLYNEPDMNIL